MSGSSSPVASLNHSSTYFWVRGVVEKNIDLAVVTAISAFFLKTRGIFWAAGTFVPFAFYKWGEHSLENIAQKIKTGTIFLSLGFVGKIFSDLSYAVNSSTYVWVPISSIIGLSLVGFLGKKYFYPVKSSSGEARPDVSSSASTVASSNSSSSSAGTSSSASSMASSSSSAASSATATSSSAAPIPAATVAVANPPEEIFWTRKKVLTLATIATTILFCGAKFQWECSWGDSVAIGSLPLISLLAKKTENNADRIKHFVSKYFFEGEYLAAGSAALLFFLNRPLFFSIAETAAVGYGAIRGLSWYFNFSAERVKKNSALPEEEESSCCGRACSFITKILVGVAVLGLAAVGGWTLYQEKAYRVPNFPFRP